MSHGTTAINSAPGNNAIAPRYFPAKIQLMTSTKPTSHSVLGRVKTSYPRIQHLLVPLDFSGKSRQALRYAVPVAQKFSAKIHLVHVLDPQNKKERADLPRLKQQAVKKINEMAQELLPPKVRTDNLVLSGKPSEQILAAAKKFGVDLIVITTKGQSGLKRMLIGSTAEIVMRHALCPVMSIRRQ